MDLRSRPRFPSPAVALALVMAALVGNTAVSMLWRMFFPDTDASVLMRYAEILVAQMVAIALPAGLYLLIVRPEASALRWRPLPIGACACLLVGAVFAMVAVQMLTVLWVLALEALGWPLVGSNIPIPTQGDELWAALLVVGVVPALCEELLFRNLLLPSLERLGTRRAVLLSGLLFALMHGLITGLPAHLLLGFILGALLAGYGTMWAPMLFHAAYNGTSMLFAYAAQSYTPPEALDAAATAAASNAEVLTSVLPLLLLAAPAAIAFLVIPMRMAARKHPPLTYERGEPLSTAAVALIVLLLLLFLAQYALSMAYTASLAGGAL